MSKVAHYLQEHLIGEVMTSTDARRYFATDGSVLQIAPALIVYPRSENDVRKTARFSWQLAERGRVIPITARGAGTDQTGAAIGSGIMLVFPAHMNRVLELDTKANTVTVEPGINFGKLQQTLQTHGRFIPSYPSEVDYSTIGGAIANNASGEKSFKYGDTRAFVQGLRVVLANGEVIETGRLSKREFSKKLGLATFEGEIYRSVDTLIEENHDLVDKMQHNLTLNSAGYDLMDVKRKDGSFDLTPLLVGSQGTLAITTEAVLATEAHSPQSTLMMAQFDSLEHTQAAILELREMSDMPSSVEIVDEYVLQQIQELNPNQLKEVVKAPFPAITMLVEFEVDEKHAKKVTKKADKIFDKYAVASQTATDPEQQQQLWKIRQATSYVLAHNEGLVKSVPLIDAAVAPDRVREYLEGLYALLETNNIKPAVWGHAGDGNLILQPRLNLGQVGDRQKAFRFMADYHKLVLSLGGTIAAASGEGRLRAAYLEPMYGTEIYQLMLKVKNIFDPYGTLNPGVKFGTSLDDIKTLIRPDFTLEHIYDHLPRS
jgi:FAD/FMN-containing dehydrogenase